MAGLLASCADCKETSLSLSTWAKCDAFKEHQEYFLEVQVFHPVALAGFQIVSIGRLSCTGHMA